MIAKFLPRQLDDKVSTTQHVFRGHINITPIFQAKGKKVSDFTKSRRFNEIVEAFKTNPNPKHKSVFPVVIKASGKQESKGTWIHPWVMVDVCKVFPEWVEAAQIENILQYADEWTHNQIKPLEVAEVVVKPRTSKLIDAQNEIARLNGVLCIKEQNIQVLQQKANAYHAIMDCGGWFSLNSMAKILGAMGPNNLRKWMTDQKIVFLKEQRVVPYQEYVDRGWMKAFIRQFTVEKHEEVRNYPVTRYTMKGVVGIFNMLKKDNKLAKDAVLNLDTAATNGGDKDSE